jgi:site-specific recombinase XerD
MPGGHAGGGSRRSFHQRGRRLDRHGAGRIVCKTARRAQIGKTVTPHTLRHAFITATLDAGVPLRDVQEAASHALADGAIRACSSVSP